MLLASAALVALGVLAAPAEAGRQARQDPGAAAGGLGLQLLDIPVARVEDPRARAYIVDHVTPGMTIKRRVEVSNSSPKTQRVELYSGAANIEQNTFTVTDGRGGNELSRWTRLATKLIDLAPGAKQAVEVTIAVPDAASRGERYGAVWAQITSPPGKGGNVLQIHRVGVRVYLDVGPGGEPPTDFRIEGLAVERGTGQWPVLTARVTNTGERALDMTGSMSLANDTETVRAGPFGVTTGVTILPGQQGQVSAPIGQSMPDGVWHAELKLRSGMIERVATGQFSLPLAADSTALEPVSGGGPLLIIVAVLVAVLLAALAWYLVRRRRRARAEYDEDLYV
ncbi:hypothetical protein Cme02nite_34190 [Catellatospora methionotrophica]|uniref:Peptidase n=1 Tax=Catellatospora methionotrophica TaxID=121620 RepID=A0A8J3L635_9ACTN|nr:hypothetical protein [Catellatospora methionotrophica]GIG15087.1 hypothetical protein Cme02nite_34190 [Catellatospora methionotrophica]